MSVHQSQTERILLPSLKESKKNSDWMKGLVIHQALSGGPNSPESYPLIYSYPMTACLSISKFCETQGDQDIKWNYQLAMFPWQQNAVSVRRNQNQAPTQDHNRASTIASSLLSPFCLAPLGAFYLLCPLFMFQPVAYSWQSMFPEGSIWGSLFAFARINKNICQ